MRSWRKALSSRRQQLHEIPRQIGCVDGTCPIDRAETGGSIGLRDEGLLESALAAAENRRSYEAADLVTCAATYAYHLTQAHAFIDGNKRVAAAVTETFLESNGSQLAMTDAELVQLFLDIAAGLLSRDEVERLLRARIG